MELKTIDNKTRIINLFGDITEENAKSVIEKIVEINIEDTNYIDNVISIINACGFGIDSEHIQLPPIIFNLSTYGGECYDGLSICDAVKTSNTDIKIICHGKIMSMGIPILLSAKYKAAHKHTVFMIHGASTFELGKAEHVRQAIEETNRLEELIIDYILKNSKFPKKTMTDIIKKQKDFYFTAEQALEWKIIDEIIE